MKRNLSDYLVALAVIACSIVLLGALTVALSGYRLKKPTRTLQIDYRGRHRHQGAFRSSLCRCAGRARDRDASSERGAAGSRAEQKRRGPGDVSN